MNSKKFAVIGGGSWGTALACMLPRASDHSLIYTKDSKISKEINQHHTNSKYLPETLLPDKVKATSDFSDIIDYEMIVIAIPSTGFCSMIDQLKIQRINPEAILLVASKGMCEEPLEFFSEKIQKTLENKFAFIHGPNFAKEVAEGKPASITVASEDFITRKKVMKEIKSDQLSLEETDDIMTVQIASMTKNIFAIKSGIMQAKGAGENIKASLISQALTEISILSSQLGGEDKSLALASVVGDLVLTCYSQTSRNTKFGYEFCKNNYSKGFLNDYPVLVEGVQSARLLKKLISNMNIKLPIIEEVADLVSF